MRARLGTIGRLTTSVGPIRLGMSVGVHTGPVDLFRVGSSHRELLVTGPAASTVVHTEHDASAGQVLLSAATAAAVDPSLVGEPLGDCFLLRRRRLDVEVGSFPARPEISVDLSPSVPIALREVLAAGDDDPEHRHVALAFVHFDGVDDCLATEGPECTARWLHELVSGVQAAADAEGVTFLASDVDADGGKLILAAGAPRAAGDDEARLLRAVRRLVDGQGGARLTVRAGVHSGPVFAGSVGPHYRRTYTVMGDTVNLTARLMAKAGAGEVLASAAALEPSKTRFMLTELPAFTVKGKRAPVQAWAVGVIDHAGNLGDAPVEFPLIGRDAEVYRLERALRSTNEGRGGLVEVVADAGLGKSRLVTDVIGRADGFRVLSTRGEPYQVAVAYWAFRSLLAGALGLDDHAHLADRVAERTPHLSGWLPLLAEVLGDELPDTELTAGLEPRFRRDRTVWAVLELLGAVLRGPTVFVVDDAQWLDEPTAELLTSIARAGARTEWMVCLARRPGVSPIGVDTPLATVELGPLTSVDARALVGAASGSRPMGDADVSTFVDRSGGHPLFLVDLLRSWLSSGQRVLPDSVEAVVSAEIDRLDAVDRRLLRQASVLGVSFTLDELRLVVTDDLTAAAAQAARRLSRFVMREGKGFRFRNPCYREVAYGALPFRLRRALHGRAADVIAAAAPDPEARAEVLSLHLARADRPEGALRYASLAAERAMKKYALAEAIELLDRALAASSRTAEHVRAELYVHYGDVLQVAGRYGEAIDMLHRARRLSTADALAEAHVCRRLSETLTRTGQHRSAVRWINQGLKRLEGDDRAEAAAVRASLLAQLGFLRQASGRPLDALRHAEAAIVEAEPVCEQMPWAVRAMAKAYTVLDWAHLSMGHPDLAVHGDRAASILQQLGDRGNQASLVNNLGTFAYWQGDWSGALGRYRQAREANLSIGNLPDAAACGCNLAEILIDQGALDEAHGYLREAVALWTSTDATAHLAIAESLEARAALRAGQWDAAEQMYGHLVDQAQAAGVTAAAAEAMVGQAEARLGRGDVRDALERLADAASLAGPVTAAALAPVLERVRARALAQSQRYDEAWAAYRTSLDASRAANQWFDVLLDLRGLIALGRQTGLPVDPIVADEAVELTARLAIVRWPTGTPTPESLTGPASPACYGDTSLPG